MSTLPPNETTASNETAEAPTPAVPSHPMTVDEIDNHIPTERATPPWMAEAIADWREARESVRINPMAGEIPAALNAELYEFPVEVAKWAFKVSEATRALQFAQMEADDNWAAAEEKARMVLGPTKRGEVSTSDYQRAARRDPAWRASELRRIHADAKLARRKAVLEGLRTKREGLMSIGASLRVELQANPHIREEPRSNNR